MKTVIRKLAPAPMLDVYRELKRHWLYGDPNSPTAIFSAIHRKGLWGGGESVSGPGSSVAETSLLRADLEAWLEREKIRSLVDLPCGDFNWMRLIRFPAGMRYLGMDIVPEIVAQNARRYSTSAISFERADILSSELPEADAYLCKDLFIHFPNAAIEAAIDRLRGKARFLLATTQPLIAVNEDIKFGEFRPTNLALVLGQPAEMLNFPKSTEGDRYIGVWPI